ncbi:MAG TPA: SGNH/GDSL hydrolase family protein [Candidatus Eisenbacteria bacterium]|nr:SGNH/GDSL hydrolase family protein [Candidatus Eisenbacteria bacterium]
MPRGRCRRRRSGGGGPGARRRAWLAAALVASGIVFGGCGHDAPTIVCIGDSITEGVTRVGSTDDAGGYPGRLQTRLGASARVVNRGVGGASTRLWLLDSREAAAEDDWWKRFRERWGTAPLPPPGRSLLRATLERDRPDVVVVLLGVNDVYYERTDPAPPEVVARTVARLATIVSEARATGATVLLGTALPNHRDPPARVAALNAAVGTLAPDHLPTGERFGERDWPRLLADDVHPNGDGYQVLADVLAEELVRRGLVRQ